VKLDGSGLASFQSGRQMNDPSCVAVDRVSGYLYWGSASASTIAVISLSPGSMLYQRVILSSSNSTVASPVDLAVDPVHGFVSFLQSVFLGENFYVTIEADHLALRSCIGRATNTRGLS